LCFSTFQWLHFPEFVLPELLGFSTGAFSFFSSLFFVSLKCYFKKTVCFGCSIPFGVLSFRQQFGLGTFSDRS
jgi:hypothetical protein